MEKVISVRTPEQSFDLTVAESLPHFYVDGFSSMNVGVPLTRIIAHLAQPPIFGELPPVPGDPERRKAVVELSVPTLQLFDFALKVMQAARVNKETLIGGASKRDELVKEFFEKLLKE
ncbi:hypothetical protein [Caballeronia sp. dw_19]|uniref:hypothetical protein n=1 Tax=Caballeronia sp. dw_19 TaxID=2719791 RepID=UPI001BCC86AE|nr:hypothetical protein [Caballeronia sp. dw_19]